MTAGTCYTATRPNGAMNPNLATIDRELDSGQGEIHDSYDRVSTNIMNKDWD